MLSLTPSCPAGSALRFSASAPTVTTSRSGAAARSFPFNGNIPKSRMHWLVLTSTPARKKETIAATKSLIRTSHAEKYESATSRTDFCQLTCPRSKRSSNASRRIRVPTLILTHHGMDRHQDHRLVSEVTWQTFRDHMIWEYEIPKYDGDLVTPNMYVPLLPPRRRGRSLRSCVHSVRSVGGRGSRLKTSKP